MVQKSGAWYSRNGERIGQGRETARTWLKNNPAVAEELYQLLLDKHLPKRTVGEESAAGDKKSAAAEKRPS